MERLAGTIMAARVPGVRHFIYAPARAQADRIRGVLEREGWETSIDVGDDVVLVTASCLRVLTGSMVRETHARLTSLAQHHGGAYDGSD